MKTSYNKKFEQLQHLLLGAYETFYVWKTLQKEEYNKTYTINNGFWGAVLPALQHEWFIGLARLFENSKYTKNGKVFSMYSLIEEHPDKERVKMAKEFLDKNIKAIENITRIRDHRHAHNNVSFHVDPKESEKKFPIKYSEIEDIFEFTDKMLGILHPDDGHGYSLDHLKEEAERDTKDVIDGLEYFNNKRIEHRNLWVKNGAGTIHFPPKDNS